MPMKHSILRLLSTLVVALLLVSVLSDVADAQRRRRRRRRRRPPRVTAPAEPPAEATPDEGAPAEPAPEEAPPAEAAQATEPPAESEPAAAPVEPEPAAEPTPPADPEPAPVDLGPLREEFTAVMDDLVQVRSRIAVLGQQLFQTKVRVRVQDRAGDDQDLTRIALRLDGAPIFRGDPSTVNDDVRQVFEGFAAPGPHVLTVEAEQRARENEEYRYTTTDTYRFEVVRGKATEVTLVLDDHSDIAEEFPDEGEGEYDVRMRLRVATRELDAAP